MASIKDLRKRIISTKNTQQTTKAMKMVSAAKLRRAQEAITAQRPFARRIGKLISLLASTPELADSSPFMRKTKEGVKPKLLLVLVTSDRGLCAGFNANVLKMAQKWLLAHQANYQSVHLSFVGRKGNEYFRNKGRAIDTYYSEVTGKVTFANAKKLAESLTKKFLASEYDEVKIIYNEFKNAVTQETQVEDFLPLPEFKADPKSDVQMSSLIVKPNPRALLDALLAKHFSIQAFRILLESQASEHGARMSAMENATNNASDMIWSLTLEYNKQRQAGITKELLEIISGSESQKVSK